MQEPPDLTTTEGREQFLARTRIGILTTNRKEGTPMAVPVWFDWDGERVRMFAASTTSKVKRIQRDPRASLLVTNHLDEAECWLAFDGEVQIHDEGGFELAEQLAPRYWDLEDADRKATYDVWSQAREVFCLLTLDPKRIRNGS